jgi:hypothetical protein
MLGINFGGVYKIVSGTGFHNYNKGELVTIIKRFQGYRYRVISKNGLMQIVMEKHLARV